MSREKARRLINEMIRGLSPAQDARDDFQAQIKRQGFEEAGAGPRQGGKRETEWRYVIELRDGTKYQSVTLWRKDPGVADHVFMNGAMHWAGRPVDGVFEVAPKTFNVT